MEIKDFNYLSFSNNYNKSHYFNNLIIQKSGEYSLHYFTDMEGFFRIDKIRFPISSGAFYITHPGDHFTINPVKTKSALGYFIIKLKPKEFEGKLKLFLDSQLSHKSFQLNPNQKITLEEVLGKLNSEDEYQRESAHHMLLSFLYDLPECHNSIHTHQDHHNYIEKAVKYMHERVYEELNLGELCRHLCISEPHCIRLFKSRMSTTPMKYFTSIKIEEAISLLLSTNKPLSLIAEQLKFSSPAHFSKTFKQFMSISPKQYRNNYINTLEHREKVSIKEKEHAYDLLQTVIDAIPDLVFIKDTSGIIISGNKAICRVLGVTKEEFAGKTDYELFPKEEADFFQIRDTIIFKHNRAYKNEETMTYPDGRKRTFEVHKAPFHDAHGKILGLVGISRDITDRLNARKELEKARSQQQNLSEHQAEAMLHLSQQLSILLDGTDFSQNCADDDYFRVTRIQMLIEGLNSFIQSLFKNTNIEKKGIDPELLFIRLEKLISRSLAKQDLKLTFLFPEDLPEIVFVDIDRLIRALYFLIKALTFEIAAGSVEIMNSCRDKTLLTAISMQAPSIPERKAGRIEKLIRREEGISFIQDEKDPIELSMANIELEALSSSIKIINSSKTRLDIEITTPFPSGIEYLNQYYAPKTEPTRITDLSI